MKNFPKSFEIIYLFPHLQSTHLHGLHLQAASAKEDNDAQTIRAKTIFFNFINNPFLRKNNALNIYQDLLKEQQKRV